MRVLVVDQDSASNEAIVRSLRDLYTVDAVTNKGDCLDLLRSNTFEVIVAGERLADGSGLELLGQIARKWPSVLRIFAADRQRLELLKGRLGPFELFQTLAYPIDSEPLIATLSLAEAARHANADTSHIQHVVLSGEVSADIREPAESVPSGDLPVPRPASRISPVEHAEAPSRSLRGAGRGGPSYRARPAPAGNRLRGNGPGGPPAARIGSRSSTARGAAPVPSLSLRGGRPARYDPSRGAAGKAVPVPFPSLPKSPSLKPSQAPGANRSSTSRTDTPVNAAATARAGRPNFNSPVEDFDARGLTLMITGGAALVLAVVVLGFQLVHSRSEAPAPLQPPVVHAPQYPQEVAPVSGQHAESPKSASAGPAAGHASAKRNRQSRRNAVKAAPENQTTALAGTSGPSLPTPASTSPLAAQTTPPPGLTSPTPAQTTPPSGSTSATPAQTTPPPGLTSPTEPASVDTSVPPSGVTAPRGPAPEGAPPVAALTSAPAATTGAGAPPPPPLAPVQASPPPATSRVSPGEPPPVIREAKLIRRVGPDYPVAAKRDGLEGSVDLEVTVSARGVVKEVAVIRATPPDVFDKSALAAVRKWRYDPRFVDGLPSEAHLKVHLEFKPQ